MADTYTIIIIYRCIWSYDMQGFHERVLINYCKAIIYRNDFDIYTVKYFFSDLKCLKNPCL